MSSNGNSNNYNGSNNNGNDNNNGNNENGNLGNRRQQQQQQRPWAAAPQLGDDNDGARLSYSDLHQWDAQDPPVHDGDGVRAFPRAIRRPRHGVVVIPPPEDISNNRRESAPAPIFLMKLPETDAATRQRNVANGISEDGVTRAYAQLRNSRPILLRHHAENWGGIVFAVVYTRSGNMGDDLVFHAPTPSESQHVAIKVLNKQVVNDYLQAGGKENPYKEISIMQQLGDGVHVLPLIEVLEDDQYLYIVMPRGVRTLVDVVSPPRMMAPAAAHGLFIKILKILWYLQENNVCHHDISPDNFLFLTPDNLVLFDFGMALRLPTRNDEGFVHRTLVTRQGIFGTLPYMAPEIFTDTVFDGVSIDLWGAAAVLYTILTGHMLYHRPHYTDICFKYFVLAGGLSSVPINERTVEILKDVFNLNEEENYADHRERHALLSRSMAHLRLPPGARELFENLLQWDKSRRWTLAQAVGCQYVQRPPPPPHP